MTRAPTRVVTAAEMRRLEANAVALGVALETLMENAGRAVAEEVKARRSDPSGSVAIVAGTGNNGGDGFVAARHLASWGIPVELWLVRPAREVRSAVARHALDRIASQIPVREGVPDSAALARHSVIVDALLGTGQSGRPREPYRSAIEAIGSAGVPVVSIDVPSGLGSPLAVRPRWTVALGAVKAGCTESTAGEIIVRDIGLPPEAFSRTGPGEFHLVLPRPDDSPLGRTARVWIVGGGPYTGAPALAALAALRTGTERATVLAPAPAAGVIQGFSPDLVVRTVGTERFRPSDRDALRRELGAAPPAAIALGMGAGRAPDTLETFQGVLDDIVRSGRRIPVVLDADALALAVDPRRVREWSASGPLVLTPNAGELRRYVSPGSTGGLDESVRDAAARLGATIVAKGDPDRISDGDQIVHNYWHSPAMTVGGAGDVLAGVLASLLGQGLSPLSAARLATYWVGEAGASVASQKGYGLLASDLLEALAVTFVRARERLRASS